MAEAGEPDQSFVAGLAAVALHLVFVAGMGVVCWQAGYSQLQIGMAACGAMFAALPLVIGILGWTLERQPGKSLSRLRRVGTLARAVLLAIGLGLLAAAFVAAGTFFPPS